MQRINISDTKSQRNEKLLEWEECWQGRRRISDVELDHIMDNVTRVQRKEWPEGWLWIDALCIDQSDDRERTHQVGIMSKIFGRADQVISWLGPAYDNSELAIATITGYTSDGHTSRHPILSQAELSEAICSLCERQYWKRLWVFQELKHAKHITLMCGEVTISWDRFRLLWHAIVGNTPTNEDSSERLKQSLATRMMTLRSKTMNFSLWSLLRETENLECADPRDRVYALLSVATGGHERIEAEYDRNVTPLRLAHRTLRNKYEIRPPMALSDVLTDCEFLEGVFRMTEGAMLRYRRPRANGINDSYNRNRWYVKELQYPHGDLRASSTSPGARSMYRHMRFVYRDNFSHVDTESSQADSSWSAWAKFHRQFAITGLLQNV